MPPLASLKFSDQDLPAPFLADGIEGLRAEEFVVASRGQADDEVAFVAAIEWRPEAVLKLRPQGLPRVLRRATPEEVEAWWEARALERRILLHARERVAAMKLDVKVTRATCYPAQNRVVVLFSTEAKVDLRHLVRDLGAFTRMRVEFAQLGLRDEARAVGGFGVCGMTTCCSTWLPEFRPISVRLARDQDLPLPPGKLVGQCGRFLCCLSFEVDQYREMARGALAKGATITVQGRTGVVIDRNLIARTYLIRWEDGRIENLPAKDVQPEDVRIPDQLRRPRRGGGRPSRDQAEPLADETPPPNV